MKRLFIFIILCVFSIGVHADDEVMYVYLSDGSFRGFYNAEIDSISYSHYDLDSIWHEEMVTQDVWSRDTVERISLYMVDSISYSLPETTYKDNVIILDERYQPYILVHDSLTITFSPSLPDYLRPSVGNVLLYEGSNELFPYGFSGIVTQINGDVVLCDSASLEDVYERLYFFGTYTLVENDQGSDANGYSLCRITRSSNTTGSSNANRRLKSDDDDDSDWGIYEGKVDDIPFDTYKIAEKIEFTSKDIFAAVSGSVTPTASIEFAFIANVYEPLIFYKETDRFDYNATLQIGFNKDFTPKHPKDFDKPFRMHKVGQEAETEKGLNLYFFNIAVPVPQCPVLTIGYKAGLFIDPNLEAEAVLGVDFTMTKEKTHIFRLDKTNIWKNGDWSHFEGEPTATCEPEVEGSLTGSVWAGLMAAINVGVGSDKNGIKEELSAKIGPYIEFELNLDLIDFNSDMSFYSGLKDSKMKRGLKGAISLDFTAKMAKVFNYKWTQMQISPEKLWFEKVDYLLPEFEAPEYNTNGNTLNCSMNLTRCTFANHVGMRIVDESGNEETKWMEDTFKDWTEETPFNFGLSFDNLDFKNHRYTIIPVTRLWFFPTLKIPDPMRTYVTCPDSHHPHLIDLGLPSGVKWLCSNVYADKPADAGGYYQWGNAYKQMSYDESYTFPDIEGSNFQGSSYDAATANIGKEYVTPTADQFKELLSHCSKTIKYSNWVQEEGLFLKASNGADLYLPFSGYMNGKDVESKTKGYFVVSDKSMENGTIANPVLKLDGDEISYSSAQWYGYSVRPVSIPSSTGLALSTYLVNMKVGESVNVDVSGSGSYDAVSNAESVATVSVDGSKLVITGVSPGSATITVKDNQTQERAKIEVSVSNGGSTINVTPTEINFGEVTVEEPQTEYFTINNISDKKQTLRVEIEGSNNLFTDGFSLGEEGVEAGDNFLTVEIPVGGSYRAAIEFRPIAAEEYVTHIFISSVDVPEDKYVVTVKGKGVEKEKTFHLSANTISLYVNTDSPVTIFNGSGDYDVINENPDIVDYDINGVHVAHAPNRYCDPGEEGRPIEGDLWWITAKKIGEASLKLIDKQTNKELSLSVTVTQAPSLTLAQSNVEMNVGETEYVEILTGSQWYEVTTDKNSIVSVSKATISTSGGGGREDPGSSYTGIYAVIEALSAGEAIVTVKDLSSGETADIVVVVNPSYICKDPSPADGAEVDVNDGSIYVSCTVTMPYNGETNVQMRLSDDPDFPVKNRQSVNITLNGSEGDSSVSEYTFKVNPGTKYYWQVYYFDWDKYTYVKGSPVWTFTTKSAGESIVSIEVEPTEIDFGIVEEGTDKTETFMVKNTGGGNLTFTVLCQSSAFEVSDNGQEFTIGTGESKNYTVTGHGLASQRRVDSSISVKSNAENGNLTINMHLTGKSVSALSFSQPSVEIKVGEEARIEIKPGSGYYDFSIGDPSIVSAFISQSGGGAGGRYDTYNYTNQYLSIAGVSPGQTTIIVKDTERNEEATLYVTVTGESPNIPAEAIDLGLPSGTKWASWNVGASAPEEYGGYYAWGETEEKDYYDWSTYTHCDGSWKTCHHIGDDIAGTEYDVAHMKWGGDWRMPSIDQIKELKDNCTQTWTTQNGVNGILVTGPNGATIFLPAAGSHWDDGLYNEGSVGYFWSSSFGPGSECFAYDLDFDSGSWSWGRSGYRYAGFSVRAVCP